MIQFPNSPTQGQVFTSTTGLKYVYLDGVWRIVEAPQDIGKAEARNRIVNGAMQISQENADTAGTTSAYHPADQWYFLNSGFAANIKRAAESAATAPNGSKYALNLSLTTAKPSATFSEHLAVMQIIEGVRLADLRWGTANAKAVVLRFWFKSGVAGKTFYAALRNGAPDRTYLTTFSTATTGWEQITITVPGDTTGTWATDTGRGLHFTITVACGTDLHGVAGWQAGNKLALAGANSNGGTTLSLFLADVGLYLDPLNTGIAPPWQMPDEAEELRACQRYWTKGIWYMAGYGAAGTTLGYTAPISPAMRVTPAVTGTFVYGNSSGGLLGVPAGGWSFTGTVQITAAGNAYGQVTTVVLSARM